MTRNLTPLELRNLLSSVFRPGPLDRELSILLDLPDSRVPDTADWLDRRVIATEWHEMLVREPLDPFRRVNLAVYPNVGSNNNDLPATVTLAERYDPRTGLLEGTPIALRELLERSGVVLAMTEFSATAPLKILARTIKFRGATLPGFTRSMIPALYLDYDKVHARVMEFKERLDRAESIEIVLSAKGVKYISLFDLRHRSAHASGGLLRDVGTVGNLPSGEAYIVPYEGEKEGDPSRTAGVLPVQFDEEIVLYRLKENRAAEVLSQGPISARERLALEMEPAYANIAEVGIGVLGEWGVRAVGSILLDEKLGLHIAFGRSDHFGGTVGPDAWRDKSKVIHIDRVYVPSSQPAIAVETVTFHYPGGGQEVVLETGKYLV